MEEPSRVKEEVRHFFEMRFKEVDRARQRLDRVEFATISKEESNDLLAPFGEEETKEAMWNCGSSKSPDLDDYNFKFIKQFCALLKVDVLRFLPEFHAHGMLSRGTDSSFISFIPKVEDLQGLGEFRPILITCGVYVQGVDKNFIK